MLRFASLRRFAKLRWSDSEEVAEQLFARNTSLDPLTIKFTDLHRMVCDLPDFIEPADKSSEGKLEKIQMAWLELYQDK